MEKFAVRQLVQEGSTWTELDWTELRQFEWTGVLNCLFVMESVTFRSKICCPVDKLLRLREVSQRTGSFSVNCLRQDSLT